MLFEPPKRNIKSEKSFFSHTEKLTFCTYVPLTLSRRYITYISMIYHMLYHVKQGKAITISDMSVSHKFMSVSHADLLSKNLQM